VIFINIKIFIFGDVDIFIIIINQNPVLKIFYDQKWPISIINITLLYFTS